MGDLPWLARLLGVFVPRCLLLSQEPSLPQQFSSVVASLRVEFGDWQSWLHLT